MNKISRYRISIYSEDPDTLQNFYRAVLCLPFDRKIDVPDDYGYVFLLSANFEVFIAKHSEITGKTKEKVRHIFDLQVADVEKEFKTILTRYPNLDVVAAPFQAPCSIVATFADPEGNCWQLSERSREDSCEA
jgi:predicted enzyme related to lactoylglutathione lyase